MSHDWLEVVMHLRHLKRTIIIVSASILALLAFTAAAFASPSFLY